MTKLAEVLALLVTLGGREALDKVLAELDAAPTLRLTKATTPEEIAMWCREQEEGDYE